MRSNKTRSSEFVAILKDSSNAIIGITVKVVFNNKTYKMTFKDSIRLFPISLVNLCHHFNVGGESGKLNGVQSKKFKVVRSKTMILFLRVRQLNEQIILIMHLMILPY